MAEKAYIGLNEDHHWVLYYGNGTEAERYVLAVGPQFEPGGAIRETLIDMLQWAEDNGYELDVPLYSKSELRLEELIEPEIFDEVFGQNPVEY